MTAGHRLGGHQDVARRRPSRSRRRARCRWAAALTRFWHRVEQNRRPPLRDVSVKTRSHGSAAHTPSRPLRSLPRASARPAGEAGRPAPGDRLVRAVEVEVPPGLGVREAGAGVGPLEEVVDEGGGRVEVAGVGGGVHRADVGGDLGQRRRRWPARRSAGSPPAEIASRTASCSARPVGASTGSVPSWPGRGRVDQRHTGVEQDRHMTVEQHLTSHSCRRTVTA